MDKRVIAGMVMVLAGFVVFANGNAEKLSTVEGAFGIVPDENGQERLMLRTAAGEDVVVDMPDQERQRLQLREQDRVRVNGIYVGVPAGEQGWNRLPCRRCFLPSSCVSGRGTASGSAASPLRMRECMSSPRS